MTSSQVKLWVCLPILVIGLVACHSRADKKPIVYRVKTDTVQVVKRPQVLHYPGRVKAVRDIRIAFRVPGVVERMYVREGDVVRQGQRLALLEPADYEVQLQAVRAEYAKVEGEARRVMELYRDSVTTPMDNDRARFGLQQMQAKLRHAEDQLAYTVLTAPFDGRVQSVICHPHEAVSAGMPVLTLVGDDLPEVEVSLSVADYVRRDRFDSCSCTFDVYPDVSYPLQVVGISPKANANQLYTLRLGLADTALAPPAPGMTAWVSIALLPEVAGELLRVPASALFMHGGKNYVYVLDGDTDIIGMREVEVSSLEGDGYGIIRSTVLQPGDRVVVSGVHALHDGDHVEPLPVISATNVGGML